MGATPWTCCLLVGGGLGLAACDQIHVHTGVLSYADPALAGQAWWVPLQFAVATAAICAGAWPFAAGQAQPRTRELVAAGAWFVGAYAASGLLAGRPGVLAALLGATWLARVAVSPRRLPLAAYSLALATAGTGVEAALSATGAFAYARPDALGVPLWLPGLYLHGAPLALGLTRRLQGRLRGPRGSARGAGAQQDAVAGGVR